jgi:hypothetical protein
MTESSRTGAASQGFGRIPPTIMPRGAALPPVLAPLSPDVDFLRISGHSRLRLVAI